MNFGNWKILLSCLCLISLPVAASAQATPKHDYKKIAPLLQGMGDLHYPVSTGDSLAQVYFDQGLVLSFGFNHKEAHRSFAQAAILDSNMAMAYWGQALVLGPNINAAMNPDDAPKAWKLTRLALRKSQHASEKEMDLIKALSYRYAENPPKDRSVLDRAYAQKMGELARKYPGDMNIQTLHGEALMDLHPWDYWQKNGEPHPWTPPILDIFEEVMENEPNHPGANHLYIHAVEASKTPERALAAARRLENLVPDAGHLVHMPSHVYIRTGDYHKGTLANERAVKSDNRYVTQCQQQGVYPLAYVPHNYHFLWATATMEGRKKRSIEAAQRTSQLVDTSTMRQPGMGTLQHFWIIPIYSYVRFGQWDKILSYSKPADDLLYPLGIWHYARGLAFTANGQPEKAELELSKLEKLSRKEALNEITIWNINTTRELLKIANLVLAGEMTAQEKKYEKAIAYLRQAVSLEDQLNYNEPPDWFFPVRQNLGAILMEASQPKEAEAVYQQDLEKFPKNGWSLFGLQQSLKAQGKTEQANTVLEEFETAWKYADVQLTSSRIL